MRVTNADAKAAPAPAARLPTPARSQTFSARRKRPEEEHASAPPIPPTGGPLGLHRPAERLEAPPRIAEPEAASLVDRMIVGRTRDGRPEVRMEVAVGGLRGTEVRLAAGVTGLEATFVAASESARRVVEAQLADLARALEGRGLKVARCEVTTRPAPRLPDRDRPLGGSWEDSAA